MIAGHAAAVARAVELAKARGAKRAILLNVSAPFHCALMKPAQERLASDLDSVPILDARVPLANNVDAVLVRCATELRGGAEAPVTAPVRWEQAMRLLRYKVCRQMQILRG